AARRAEFETRAGSAAEHPKARKSEKKAASFGVESQAVKAKAAPEPEPEPTPSETSTEESDDSAGTSGESANSGSSDSDKKESKDSDSSDSGSSDSGSSDSGSIDGSKAEQVLAWAAKGVGTPYVSGGTSPSGWDCSGYTSWVYSHVGVNLP